MTSRCYCYSFWCPCSLFWSFLSLSSSVSPLASLIAFLPCLPICTTPLILCSNQNVSMCSLNQGAVKCLSFSLTPETLFSSSQMHFLLPAATSPLQSAQQSLFSQGHRWLYFLSPSAKKKKRRTLVLLQLNDLSKMSERSTFCL